MPRFRVPHTPVGNEPVKLHTPRFLIEGRSRSGHETWFRIRELGVAFDIGRCPDEIVNIEHVFVTHAHLDHAAGVPFYAAQRHLYRMPGGTVFVPAESVEDMRLILSTWERMANTSFQIELRGLEVGEEIPIGRGHVIRAHAATHRVAARAYEVLDDRRTSLLFYTGDTDRDLLGQNEAMFRSEVLMIECSFLEAEHRENAAKYRHIHIDDIADFADKFENQLIVLTHFSRRYSRDQIRDGVRRRVPHSLRERIRLALPEQWQRV